MRKGDRQLIQAKISMEMDVLRQSLRTLVNERAKASNNGLALHAMFQHLKTVAAPEMENKIRQFCFVAGFQRLDEISKEMQEGLFRGMSVIGPSFAASYPYKPGTNLNWAQNVEAWAEGFVAGIPMRTRVAARERPRKTFDWGNKAWQVAYGLLMATVGAALTIVIKKYVGN